MGEKDFSNRKERNGYKNEENVGCILFLVKWKHQKKIAEQAADETGADIARIETTEPYRGSHEDVVEQGKKRGRGRLYASDQSVICKSCGL